MESIVLCYQIRTLDKRRLMRVMDKIDNLELQEAIIDALSFQLEIVDRACSSKMKDIIRRFRSFAILCG